VIKFLCPNGHPLSSSEQRAGKPGQCPRCQTTFRVPETDDPTRPKAETATSESTKKQQTYSAESATEDTKFEFLCPNGHKLNGRSSLQGRPGQCPHCNARFLIPSLHEGDHEHEVEDSPIAEEDNGFVAIVGEPDNEADNGACTTAEAVVFSIHDEPPPAPMSVSCHPLAQIFRKLWAETRGAGVLELQLDDGVTLLAESFSAELSQHEFGVFAVRGETKTQSVTIVPWDSINRATLLNLADLPSDLFRSPMPTRRRQDRAR
jgi:hypothetical protein